MKNKKKTKKIVKKKTSTNTKNNKILLIANFVQAVLIILLGIYIYDMKLNIKKIEEEKEAAIKEEASKKGENYVFLGDSITDWYPISEFFSDDTPIINSGFAGDKTKDLLNDMDETVYRYNPTKVFIQIGTNDLNCDDSNGDIAYDNIAKMIDNIKKNRPYAKIYLESIYPVNQSDNEKIVKSTTGKRRNEDIIKLNEKLKKFCEENNVEYVDVYSALADEDGNLKIEYTVDGLHLSTEGYSVVSKLLKTYIKEK
jgi:lysophospholipase L1-like esterase